MDRSYREGWISVNKILTCVITWGCWIEDLQENQDVIFMITGNPGITKFYIKFLSKIYRHLNIPIWIVSHAGHEVPPNDHRIEDVECYPADTLYTVQDQVDHKAFILNKYVPKGCGIYIINHSVGAYMTLKLLQNPEISHKIKKCYSLFPMMENMEQTKNAWFVKKLDGFILNSIVLISKIFELLPSTVQYYLMYIGTMVSQQIWLPEDFLIVSGLQMMKANVGRNASYLAIDELKTIRQLDTKVIEEHKDKLKFYYGADDGWCPLENYVQLCKTVNGVDAMICNKGIEHAFILKKSDLMAEIVCDWFKHDLKLTDETIKSAD